MRIDKEIKKNDVIIDKQKNKKVTILKKQFFKNVKGELVETDIENDSFVLIATVEEGA